MRREIILIIIFNVLVIWTMLSCRSISTITYNLETPALKEQSSIKIILISDLHDTMHGKNQVTLINKVKEQNPDLIILSGDIIDHYRKRNAVMLLLAGISGIAPVYYVTGNHEYKTKRIQDIRELFTTNGVIILSDNYTCIEINNNEIILAGIEDPDKRRYETPNYNQNEIMEEVFRKLDEIKNYKILIAHRPERIEVYKRFSFDLILSGHTHGGQVRLPFINGLIAPHQGLFPKYGGGLYRHKNVTHIISRGLSVYFLPRINNPPELVVIIIKSENNE